MRNKLRKKYQRKLNKVVRDINKSIEEDTLWNGRFVFHIMVTNFERFSDNSGGILYTIIRGYDKKSKAYKDYKLQYAPFLPFSQANIWLTANKFITEDTDTWYNGNDPYKEAKIDYTKIKTDENIWSFKYYPFKMF